jgi:NAD-dependent dihydropyrimidine dehydrogenase PreA subunit
MERKRRMRVLFCNCSHTTLVPVAVTADARAALAAEGDLALTVVPDLCELAATRDPRLAEFLAGEDPVTIVACFPRAVRWLFHAAGLALDPARVRMLNLREASTAEALLRQIPGLRAWREPPAPGPVSVSAAAETWVPWFPVIDYDRCDNCRQCMSFCPFGVYTLDAAGRVAVTSPQACKNNCPACARLCPNVAIMFPKLAEAPINGASVNRADVERCRAVLDEQARDIAEGDIHAVLARRRLKAAYRKLERLAREQAERERAACAAAPDAKEAHGSASA